MLEYNSLEIVFFQNLINEIKKSFRDKNLCTAYKIKKMDLNKNVVHLIGSNGLIGSNLNINFSPINFIKWSHSLKGGNYFNLYEKESWRNLLNSKPKIVLFLSWPGLPNYDSDFHLTKNLPFAISLINELIENGAEKIVCNFILRIWFVIW